MFELSKQHLLNQNRIDSNSLKHTTIKNYSGYKNSFLSDFERIIFSSSFRRLQDKAQVYPLESQDFARTRLTHSIEVSSLAISLSDIIYKNMIKSINHDLIILKNVKSDIIKNKLSQQKDILKKTHQDFGLCLQNASLLHDIGNPPFGHFGEDVIKNYFKNIFCYKNGSMRKTTNNLTSLQKQIFTTIKKIQMINDLIHFDGNAQSIRIITKLQSFNSKDYGMNLTLAVIGTLFKYPFSSEKATFDHEKFGYFYSENDLIKTLESLNVFNLWGVYKEDKRNPLSLIMEAADDIACILSDFEDAVQKKHIGFEELHFISKNINQFTLGFNDEQRKMCLELIETIMEHYSKNAKNEIIEPLRNTILRINSDLREKFKYSCSEVFIEKSIDIFEGNFNGTLISISTMNKLWDFLFSIKKKFVFPKEDIIVAELQGKKVINLLLDDFLSAVFSNQFDDFVADKHKAKDENHKMMQLLSKNYIEVYKRSILLKGASLTKEEKIYFKIRMVIDHVCGMTDSYALERYLSLIGIK